MPSVDDASEVEPCAIAKNVGETTDDTTGKSATLTVSAVAEVFVILIERTRVEVAVGTV